ncbi:MAG TPA: zinc-dependent alcohol dehydrogenase family protein [Candidatus Obscuribacterales bacterium]
MVLRQSGRPLQYLQLETPEPGEDQLLIAVSHCAVCRTDLHVIDGELNKPRLPLIPGHEVVGTVVRAGSEVRNFLAGDRVGVPWLAYTCGHCQWCTSGRENLCEKARFTGYTANGGYAEFIVADHRFTFHLPDNYDAAHAAPLLCAGLIGYRSLKMAGDANSIGIYGFGAAAHIVAQVAVHQQRRVYAFTRPGDRESQAFAMELGATWAGASDEDGPEKLDAAIIFAPVGSLVPQALKNLNRGGVLVLGGIHMSDIPAFPYALLWQERSIKSVANLTRADARDFLRLAGQFQIKTSVQLYPLKEANSALKDLREGRLKGAAVLEV